MGGTLSRNLLVLTHIHQTLYDATSNSQLSEYTIHTKAFVNLILIGSLFVYRHVVQRLISITYPWNCSLQSRWLWLPPRSLRSCVFSRCWCNVWVGNSTGRGARCKLKKPQIRKMSEICQRLLRIPQILCAICAAFITKPRLKPDREKRED